MILRILVALAFLFSLTACGVKSDLVLPDGKPAAKGEKDPAKPPQPLGE